MQRVLSRCFSTLCVYICLFSKGSTLVVFAIALSSHNLFDVTYNSSLATDLRKVLYANWRLLMSNLNPLQVQIDWGTAIMRLHNDLLQLRSCNHYVKSQSTYYLPLNEFTNHGLKRIINMWSANIIWAQENIFTNQTSRLLSL